MRRTMRNIVVRWFVYLSVLSALPAFAADQPKEDFSAISPLVQSWIDKGYYPWAVLRVYQGDKLLYAGHWGCYDQADNIANIASGTKLLEAATVLTVVDEGKIKLDAPISTYLPEFTGVKGSITVRQCLSHTSGLNQLKLTEGPGEHLIQKIAGVELTDAPGARFFYGATGLTVANCIAERVTGQSFEDLFQQRIAGPLGMTHTKTGPNLYRIESAEGISLVPYTTAREYARFLEMLASGGMYHGKRVLSANSVQEMMADQVRGATMPGGNFPQEFNLTSMLGEGKHGCYGFCLWREQVDADGNATLVSCPGWSGFYPWIDRKRGVHGVFLARVADSWHFKWKEFNPMLASASLARLVGDAIDKKNQNKHEHGGMK